MTINSCTVSSPAQITSAITIVGSAATAPRGVTVTNPGGQFATLANAFTVSAAPLLSPARATYSFNAGTGLTAADLSGNSNNGTLQNGVAWTAAGKYGNALSFDGINDFVRVPDSSSLDVGSSGTIAAWVKTRCPQPPEQRPCQRQCEFPFRHQLRPGGHQHQSLLLRPGRRQLIAHAHVEHHGHDRHVLSCGLRLKRHAAATVH